MLFQKPGYRSGAWHALYSGRRLPSAFPWRISQLAKLLLFKLCPAIARRISGAQTAHVSKMFCTPCQAVGLIDCGKAWKCMEGEDTLTAFLGNLALFGATLSVYAALRNRSQRPASRKVFTRLNAPHIDAFLTLTTSHNQWPCRGPAECALALVSRTARCAMEEDLSHGRDI